MKAFDQAKINSKRSLASTEYFKFVILAVRNALCVLKKILTSPKSGFGGLEVAGWPLVPKFAGSHLAEAVEFLG
jgi:hypothetical protein